MVLATQTTKARDSRSWRRISERIVARNRHRLDEAGGVLARQLDAWNRKLAEYAVPRARRERVEALARRRARNGGRLSVVSNRPAESGERLSQSERNF